MKDIKDIPYKDSLTYPEQLSLKVDGETKHLIRRLNLEYSIDTGTLLRKTIKDALQSVLKKIEGEAITG